MTAVVIDASAGVEIVGDTRRGRALIDLLPADAQGWVPEHFYVEVIGALRRRLLVEQVISEEQARVAATRLQAWHLHRVSVRPLIDAAWGHRHNIAAADAVYVVLADHLGADLLTDDHKLVGAPTFPGRINVLRVPRPAP